MPDEDRLREILGLAGDAPSVARTRQIASVALVTVGLSVVYLVAAWTLAEATVPHPEYFRHGPVDAVVTAGDAVVRIGVSILVSLPLLVVGTAVYQGRSGRVVHLLATTHAAVVLAVLFADHLFPVTGAYYAGPPFPDPTVPWLAVPIAVSVLGVLSAFGAVVPTLFQHWSWSTPTEESVGVTVLSPVVLVVPAVVAAVVVGGLVGVLAYDHPGYDVVSPPRAAGWSVDYSAESGTLSVYHTEGDRLGGMWLEHLHLTCDGTRLPITRDTSVEPGEPLYRGNPPAGCGYGDTVRVLWGPTPETAEVLAARSVLSG